MTGKCRDLPLLAEGASLPEAAAAWAAAGWRVHPCSDATKRPLLAADVDLETGKKIKSTGGVSKASADAATVAGWWKKWRGALIGVAMGDDRLFVVDFDPRVDTETGEIWTLEQLKADTEAMMGCPLPISVTSRTPSGGTHLWLRWPDDDGPAITNRGNLPQHVDVRGKGGYVIAPPGAMGPKADSPGGRYRWLTGRAPGEVEVAEAPAALVALLRTGKGVSTSLDTNGGGEKPSLHQRMAERQRMTGDPVEAARRKYALAALDGICQRIGVPGAGRNAELNAGAFAAAQFVAAGALDAGFARAAIEAAAKANPGRDDARQIEATIDSGWEAGLAVPKDLTGVGERAGSRPQRVDGPGGAPGRRVSTSLDTNGSGGGRRSGARGASSSTLPNGKVREAPSRAEVVALVRRGGAWLRSRLTALVPYDGSDDAREAGERLAYSLGRKFAGGWIDPLVASIGRWALMERVGGTSLNAQKVEKAVADGIKRPVDVPDDWLTDIRCARHPLTDMGNAERFIARFGDDFRYTTAKGWMGWDGRRWRVLDQENDITPADVMAAVFKTVRAIQDEARAVRDSGHREDGGQNFTTFNGRGKPLWHSTALEDHGRSSESAARLSCIATLAKRWLTVQIEDFDTDPFAINCLNGTVRIERNAEGAVRAALYPHDRGDLIAKLAPVTYDPAAERPPSQLFTGVIEWAQPDEAVRRYVRQWMGYSASGHVGAQILHFWYGLGANGKSTVIDVVCASLGDYAGTIGIETFLDQGIKKRGDAATPDLAKLGGVRLLRSSEPERGAKLNAALVKAATGGEPMSVRALHKGFFDLRPQFKLTIAGNHRPDIPDTDEGIWRRIKLVPWEQSLAEADRDLDLVDKIKGDHPGFAGELDGVFAWLIDGLLDWRANGFVEPEAVREATRDYREDSDPLARFLRLCTEKAVGERVQSSVLHAVFCAWARAAGEAEWKQKGFTQAMKAKGYENKASNGMQFLDLRLIKQVTDFVDADGHVISLAREVTGNDAPGGAGVDFSKLDGRSAAARPFSPPDDDDYDPDPPSDWRYRDE